MADRFDKARARARKRLEDMHVNKAINISAEDQREALRASLPCHVDKKQKCDNHSPSKEGGDDRGSKGYVLHSAQPRGGHMTVTPLLVDLISFSSQLQSLVCPSGCDSVLKPLNWILFMHREFPYRMCFHQAARYLGVIEEDADTRGFFTETWGQLYAEAITIDEFNTLNPAGLFAIPQEYFGMVHAKLTDQDDTEFIRVTHLSHFDSVMGPNKMSESLSMQRNYFQHIFADGLYSKFENQSKWKRFAECDLVEPPLACLEPPPSTVIPIVLPEVFTCEDMDAAYETNSDTDSDEPSAPPATTTTTTTSLSNTRRKKDKRKKKQRQEQKQMPPPPPRQPTPLDKETCVDQARTMLLRTRQMVEETKAKLLSKSDQVIVKTVRRDLSAVYIDTIARLAVADTDAAVAQITSNLGSVTDASSQTLARLSSMTSTPSATSPSATSPSATSPSATSSSTHKKRSKNKRVQMAPSVTSFDVSSTSSSSLASFEMSLTSSTTNAESTTAAALTMSTETVTTEMTTELKTESAPIELTVEAKHSELATETVTDKTKSVHTESATETVTDKPSCITPTSLVQTPCQPNKPTLPSPSKPVTMPPNKRTSPPSKQTPLPNEQSLHKPPKPPNKRVTSPLPKPSTPPDKPSTPFLHKQGTPPPQKRPTPPPPTKPATTPPHRTTPPLLVANGKQGSAAVRPIRSKTSRHTMPLNEFLTLPQTRSSSLSWPKLLRKEQPQPSSSSLLSTTSSNAKLVATNTQVHAVLPALLPTSTDDPPSVTELPGTSHPPLVAEPLATHHPAESSVTSHTPFVTESPITSHPLLVAEPLATHHPSLVTESPVLTTTPATHAEPSLLTPPVLSPMVATDGPSIVLPLVLSTDNLSAETKRTVVDTPLIVPLVAIPEVRSKTTLFSSSDAVNTILQCYVNDPQGYTSKLLATSYIKHYLRYFSRTELTQIVFASPTLSTFLDVMDHICHETTRQRRGDSFCLTPAETSMWMMNMPRATPRDTEKTRMMYLFSVQHFLDMTKLADHPAIVRFWYNWVFHIWTKVDIHMTRGLFQLLVGTTEPDEHILFYFDCFASTTHPNDWEDMERTKWTHCVRKRSPQLQRAICDRIASIPTLIPVYPTMMPVSQYVAMPQQQQPFVPVTPVIGYSVAAASQ